MKVKEQLFNIETATEIFGNLNRYVLATDQDTIKPGDIVTLVNRNCEFEFDNATGQFENNLLYYFIADLELIEMNLDEYQRDKSNNGGCYAFAECRVIKVYEKSY